MNLILDLDPLVIPATGPAPWQPGIVRWCAALSITAGFTAGYGVQNYHRWSTPYSVLSTRTADGIMLSSRLAVAGFTAAVAPAGDTGDNVRGRSAHSPSPVEIRILRAVRSTPHTCLHTRQAHSSHPLVPPRARRWRRALFSYSAA